MKRETTPKRVTDKIIELCNSTVLNGIPERIPVKVQQWSKSQECFQNVSQMVQENGGQQVYGWAIWQWANMLIEAEAHAVWQSPDGNLIDITPHDNRENEILFLRDDSMEYSGKSIGNIRIPLTSSLLVAELIELSEMYEAVMMEYKPGTQIPIEELQKKIAPTTKRRMEILEMINQKVGRNDLCPCGSGLKYKRCCGRDI